MATQKIFTPTQIGLNTLHHRVVLAPLTRYRASDDHIPITHLVAEHYAQRAAVRGTLLIAEATSISPQAGGFANVPGIWNDAQIQAWKEVCHVSMSLYWYTSLMVLVCYGAGCGRSPCKGLLHISATVGSRADCLPRASNERRAVSLRGRVEHTDCRLRHWHPTAAFNHRRCVLTSPTHVHFQHTNASRFSHTAPVS